MDFYILDDDIAVVKTLKHIITERKIGTVIGYNTDVECAIEDIKEENPSIIMVDFMMKEELGLEEPDPKRALRSALTIGLAYIAGGIIPLAPYAFNVPITTALLYSVVLTLIALFLFGWMKGRFTGVPAFRSAVQTMFVGAMASGVAFLIARAVSGMGGEGHG